MLDEQWVPIEGFPNYEVSNYGRIVNLTTGVDLRPHADKKSGVLRVTLYNEGKRKNVQVARIVLEGFFLNYHKDSVVGYENGDVSDCSVLNLTLREVDHVERAAFQLAQLPTGAKISFIDMTEAQIVQVILRAQKIRETNGIA